MDATDGGTLTLRVEVDAMRRVTYQVSIASGTALATPTVSMDYQFDASDVIVPVIRILQHTDVAVVVMEHLNCGYINA